VSVIMVVKRIQIGVSVGRESYEYQWIRRSYVKPPASNDFRSRKTETVPPSSTMAKPARKRAYLGCELFIINKSG
jgi:hypothetical protein